METVLGRLYWEKMMKSLVLKVSIGLIMTHYVSIIKIYSVVRFFL